jgi:hypothetical protein
LNFKDKDLWYLVGLIATDGNLSSDGRHVDITSKHLDYLETIRVALGLENKIGIKRREKGSAEYYHIQIANKNFYELLVSVGLTSNKSLTLGKLKIPSKWFSDFVRGVIDGDGSIRKWIHPSNGKEQWSIRIYSASPVFIDWLKQEIERNFLAKGKIHSNSSGVAVLKFGKLAAKRILKACYYENCLGLAKKARLARVCSSVAAGWGQSKTLIGTV